MEKDLMIDGGLAKVNELLEELEKNKPGLYAFETNCRYESKAGKVINIKTLTDTDDLANILVEINTDLVGYQETKKELEGILNLSELKIGGFLADQWKKDIIYLIKKLTWNNRVKDLKVKKEKLEALYSQDKKDSIALDELLASI